MKKTFLFPLGLALILAASAAFAHAPLRETVPADGAVLEAPPEQLELRFGSSLRMTAVTLTDAAGERISLDGVGGRPAVEHAFELPELEPGRYTVQWRGMAADGHVMSGQLEFKLAGD